MISFGKPSSDTIVAFVAAQSILSFTYPAVGGTATVPPDGYAVDHTRVKLGAGEETFTLAVAVLKRWEQFRLGWVELYPSSAAILKGQTVAVVRVAQRVPDCIRHR